MEQCRNFCIVYTLPPSAVVVVVGRGGGVEPPTKFSKRGGLDKTSTFGGGCWGREGDFFQGGCNFHIKKTKI